MRPCDHCEVYEANHEIHFGTIRMDLCNNCALTLYALAKGLKQEIQRRAEERNKAKKAERP